jgi:hypothetical protein
MIPKGCVFPNLWCHDPGIPRGLRTKVYRTALTKQQWLTVNNTADRQAKKTTLARFELTLPKEQDFKSCAITTPPQCLGCWYIRHSNNTCYVVKTAHKWARLANHTAFYERQRSKATCFLRVVEHKGGVCGVFTATYRTVTGRCVVVERQTRSYASRSRWQHRTWCDTLQRI